MLWSKLHEEHVGIGRRRWRSACRSRPHRRADTRHHPAQMGDAGPVRRLLRRQDKGFYDEAGLDVTIKPGGPDVSAARR